MFTEMTAGVILAVIIGEAVKFKLIRTFYRKLREGCHTRKQFESVQRIPLEVGHHPYLVDV